MFPNLIIFSFFFTLVLGNQSIILKTRTAFLEKYVSYSDVVLIHLRIPPNTLFASFKFVAEETPMSIFGCPVRNVSLYMKHGSPPVINPDGSKFPKSFKNITRNKLYNLEFQTDKKPFYLNITSPFPGSYFAVTFLSYSDPKYNAIQQQGLTPSCYANVEATVSVAKVDTPLIINANDLNQIISTTLISRYFKFFVSDVYDHVLIVIDEINLSLNAEKLVVRISVNTPPSECFYQEEKVFYKNSSSMSFILWTAADEWHYIEFRFQNKTIENEVVPSNSTFKVKYFPRKLFDKSVYEQGNESDFNSTRIFHGINLTSIVPYKQYDLIRDASSDTFLFSFLLEGELDSNIPIPINITSIDFSVLKFKINDINEVGGTLQFIIAFKPRILKRGKQVTFSNEPENHTVIACIRKDVMEIPMWPDKCASSGTETHSQLILNKSIDNSSIYIPYPESGIWYATFKLFCGNCTPCNCSEDCQTLYYKCLYECEENCAVSCEDCSTDCNQRIIHTNKCNQCNCDGPCLRSSLVNCNTSIVFDIASYPCLVGQCSSNGKCGLMVSDGIAFSTCICSNRYRGWDCSDGSQATPYYMLILELLLLVLSNLAFLPAVFVAYRREYYIEAISYIGICFFSIFYHACDAGENIVNYCLVRLDSLQFGDFFCALLAIWVTIIAIADLPQLTRSVLHMMGAIILAFCTTIDKTALWIFTLPVCSGIAIVIVSWYIKYKKVKQTFAAKRYFMVHLPIGGILVGVGLIMYAFLQTEDNYKYLHSIWHIIMATALVIVLPKPNTFLPEILL